MSARTVCYALICSMLVPVACLAAKQDAKADARDDAKAEAPDAKPGAKTDAKAEATVDLKLVPSGATQKLMTGAWPTIQTRSPPVPAAAIA